MFTETIKRIEANIVLIVISFIEISDDDDVIRELKKVSSWTDFEAYQTDRWYAVLVQWVPFTLYIDFDFQPVEIKGDKSWAKETLKSLELLNSRVNVYFLYGGMYFHFPEGKDTTGHVQKSRPKTGQPTKPFLWKVWQIDCDINYLLDEDKIWGLLKEWFEYTWAFDGESYHSSEVTLHNYAVWYIGK